MKDPNPEKYRIKELNNYFYPQFYNLLYWWDFKELIGYDAEQTVKFMSLKEANDFIKTYISGLKANESKKQENPIYHKVNI